MSVTTYNVILFILVLQDMWQWRAKQSYQMFTQFRVQE